MAAEFKFEKWQALGNDYLIVEREKLPFALTPERASLICDPHFGVGSDGILELSPPTTAGFVADLRIFNPDGSEAELSGNGAREAILYLVARGWTDQKQFSINTKAGEIRPTILSANECRVDMGRAFVISSDYPDGGETGAGTVQVSESDGSNREFKFQHIKIGNPQCSMRVADVAQLEALDLETIGPQIENSKLFPNRTNVSWWTEIEPGVIKARIFERGVGQTASSGTGASGAAVSYALTGGGPEIKVLLDGGELLANVSDDLHVDLTGWGKHVYSAVASDDFVQQLTALPSS